MSPVLANIYLHYVLDMWFEKRYANTCHGKASLIRFADDFIACFHREEDAKRFVVELKNRLAEFDLEVEPSKTALVRFGSQAVAQCKQEGHRRPQTFNFLGFTHYVGRSRSGRFVVGRKTQRERIRSKLKALSVHLARLRVQGGRAMMELAYRHLRGHLQYFGVSGNSRSLRQYKHQVRQLLFKWLNRRSQRRSITWQRFGEIMSHYLPRMRIIHNLYPSYLWKT